MRPDMFTQGALALDPRVAPRQFFALHVRKLTWLAMFITVLLMNLVQAHAAKQKTVRKETPKAKSNSRTILVRPTPASEPKSLLQSTFPPLPDPLERREYMTHRVRAGETVSDLLGRYGLSATDRQIWARSISRNLGRQSLPTGREVHLYFAKPTFRRSTRLIPGQLKAVEIDQDDSSILTWEKAIRGIIFQKREKPYDVEVKAVSGSVETSLFEDGRRIGIQPALLSQLADIFTWDLDMEKDIHKGDSFKILYEQRSRKGQETKSILRILAAEIVSAGQKLTAVYFEKQRGQGNYYNLEGRSLARSFLRFPLEFTAITSHFTESRFNPILKTNLPHTGVDFAAQRGTPVRAVGDGVVAEAGWNGGYGKAIEIKHDSTYMSRYAHLDSFAPGIKVGSTVAKGQVIGYVGSTGRSTGPHLHFELYKDQQYIDPLSVDFPAEETIEPSLQKIFENQTQNYLVELSEPPQS